MGTKAPRQVNQVFVRVNLPPPSQHDHSANSDLLLDAGEDEGANRPIKSYIIYLNGRIAEEEGARNGRHHAVSSLCACRLIACALRRLAFVVGGVYGRLQQSAVGRLGAAR
jgi:hypothetical protein